MIPGMIAAHPDFPEAWHVFNKPESMTDEECGSISARMTISHDRFVGWTTEWYPTPEEMELLAAGQPIRFNMLVPKLIPHMAWVRALDEV